MIYYIKEWSPDSPESYTEFVDFEDIEQGWVEHLLQTQTARGGWRHDIAASIPDIVWHGENLSINWTRYISLEYFFSWESDPPPGEPTPPPRYDQPIEAKFKYIPTPIFYRLATGYAKQLEQHVDRELLQAFRAAVLKFKGQWNG